MRCLFQRHIPAQRDPGHAHWFQSQCARVEGWRERPAGASGLPPWGGEAAGPCSGAPSAGRALLGPLARAGTPCGCTLISAVTVSPLTASGQTEVGKAAGIGELLVWVVSLSLGATWVPAQGRPREPGRMPPPGSEQRGRVGPLGDCLRTEQLARGAGAGGPPLSFLPAWPPRAPERQAPETARPCRPPRQPPREPNGFWAEPTRFPLLPLCKDGSLR